MANPKCVGGSVLAVISFILLTIFVAINIALPKLITEAVNDNIILDSTDAPGYDAWSNSCSGEIPEVYESFWFYNLTNYEDVILNVTPHFEKLGPYVYLTCMTKVNVSFPENGDQIKFSTQYTFHWQEDMSNGTEDDVIISLNQVNLAAATFAGHEAILYGGPLFAYFRSMGKYFDEVFPLYALNEYFIQDMIARRSNLLPSVKNNESTFETAWANYTETTFRKDGLDFHAWEGIYLAEYNSQFPSKILDSVAALLWNASYPFSLLDSSYESQSLWIAAENNELESKTNISAKGILLDLFNLSPSQLDLILTWRVAEKAGDLKDDLIEYVNSFPVVLDDKDNEVETLADIGGLQWATMAVVSNFTNDVSDSVNSLAPLHWKDRFRSFHPSLSKAEIESILDDVTIFIPSFFPPEIASFIEDSDSDAHPFTTKIYRELFSHPGGFLMTPGSFGAFFACDYLIKHGNFEEKPLCSTELSLHGLDSKHHATFHSYMWDYIYPTIAPFLNLPATGLGLIDAETVYQRLWFGPLGLGAGNNTIRDWNVTMWSGKSDRSLASQIIEWEDHSYLCSYYGPECTFLEGFWPEEASINGSAEGTQFPQGTGLDKENTYVWDSDILRTVLLLYNGTQDVMGVTGYRYIVSSDQLGIDPAFDQNIYGLANLTHLSLVSTAEFVTIGNLLIEGNSDGFVKHRDDDVCLLPVFLSYPDFDLVAENVSRTVTGLTPDFIEDVIYLVIEPVTGATIQARKQLQYNLYLREEYASIYDEYYKNITGPYGEVLWPVVVIDEHGTLDKELADELQFILYDAQTISNYCLWVGVPLASILFITGIVLGWLGYRSMSSKAEYETIN
mmetsp:Transcript_22144/g.30428  ORF Transcript_22144/g.30428 Transcript_22144/m.30428 type:complete len:846 (-) Transcript_22144:57-2594(-)